MLEKKTIHLLAQAIQSLESRFDLPDYSAPSFESLESVEEVLAELIDRLADNYPYFHPLYAGQMIKPPHPVARLAYMISLWINPNNHALDGGRASSAMEKEVVKEIAQMFGWEESLGHLTGGGTMANLEAIWVSGLIHPAECIAASDQAHYTHERISGVLGVPFTKIKSDHKGRMDMKDLKHQLDERSIGTVVVTMGTTGLGAVDPLKDILALQEAYSFRIHVDAAYGGYYLLCESLSDESLSHFQLIGQADSVVIDPHKHGLQPYGCGCVIFRDQSVGTHYLHDSPYTYFSSSDLHLGEISLECSRPGASAVALWATHRLLPLTRSGEFASNLNKSRMAALRLVELIEQSNEFELVCPPELDIVVWYFNAKSTRIMSTLANNLFKLAAKKGLHLALYNYPAEKMNLTDTLVDTPYVTCLRSCLMKEDHLEWIDRIWHIIEDCRDELLSS